MAVCGSLRSLLDGPMPPESQQTLVDSLSSSWNQTHPVKPIEPAASVAEIFGELYFQEERTVAEPPSVDVRGQVHVDNHQLGSFLGGYHSPKNHEPMHTCTEGLGSESSDDVDDLMMMENEGEGRHPQPSTAAGCTRNGWNAAKSSAKSAAGSRVFPPPISSIGKDGRPWVCLRPYREDGRFVLRETRIPRRELLRASREDGRLRLHFVHPDEEEEEGGEEEEEEGV